MSLAKKGVNLLTAVYTKAKPQCHCEYMEANLHVRMQYKMDAG